MRPTQSRFTSHRQPPPHSHGRATIDLVFKLWLSSFLPAQSFPLVLSTLCPPASHEILALNLSFDLPAATPVTGCLRINRVLDVRGAAIRLTSPLVQAPSSPACEPIGSMRLTQWWNKYLQVATLPHFTPARDPGQCNLAARQGVSSASGTAPARLRVPAGWQHLVETAAFIIKTTVHVLFL